MRRLLAVVLMGALVVGIVASPSLAGKKKKPKPVVFEESGTITAANPAAQLFFGVTEGEFVQANACASMPQSQGVDGHVVDLPEAFHLKAAQLEVVGTSAAPHDLAVYFYDFGCGLMNDYTLNAGADESGSIPPGARWIVIDQLTGANTAFVLTATTV